MFRAGRRCVFIRRRLARVIGAKIPDIGYKGAGPVEEVKKCYAYAKQALA